LRSPVAVVIVNFRVYEELDRALVSVAAVTGPTDEVVVFDQVSDASSVAQVSARHPQVAWLVSHENVGFAAAVNRAVRQTTTPNILLLNPDAVAGDGLVDALASWLATYPACGMVGPRIFDEDGTVQASARRFPDFSTAIAGRSTWLSARFPDNWLTRRNLLARDTDGAMTVDWLAGSCFMVRRELFDRLGGFDEGFFLYWEDADLAWRARDLGHTCTYLPSVSVRHVGGRSAARDPSFAIRAFHRSAYRLFTKRSGLPGRLVAPLVRLGLWARGEWHARRAAR